jgi:hypothetical protein
MRSSIKLAIGLLPFLAAGAMGSYVVLPAYQDDQSERADVASKQAENDLLVAKLRDRKKAETERKTLEGDIDMLRGSVPKAPELDLFMLDLEKMCKKAGVDLIAVETPEPEAMRNLDTSNDEMQKAAQTGSKIGLGSKTMEKRQQGQASDEHEPKEDQTALKQLTKQVYVTGNYDGIVALMKELENYQRVTGVRQVCVATAGDKEEVQAQSTQNGAGDRAKKLALPENQPVMSFMMTLYYLP